MNHTPPQRHGASSSPPSLSSAELPFVASSLVEMGSELLSRGNGDAALNLFDSAHRMLAAPCPLSISTAVKQMQMGINGRMTNSSNNMSSAVAAHFTLSLSDCSTNGGDDSDILEDDDDDCSLLFNSPPSPPPPDIYREDEADVGPRLLPTPVRCFVDNSNNIGSSVVANNIVLIEAVTLFNKALIHHTKSQLGQAKHLYKLLASAIQNLLLSTATTPTGGTTTTTHPSVTLLEIGMRVHNNLGLLAYVEGDDIASRIQFQASLLFSKELLALAAHTPNNNNNNSSSNCYRLEHATILSNWCRVNWMRGENICSESLYAGLQEILCIRSSLLAWDHPDVACAHYNLAAAEYARQNTHKAVSHLKKYLHVAAHRRQQQNQQDESNNHNSKEEDDDEDASMQQQQQQQQQLDPIPALIYLLLLENENQDNRMSQELVRGLHTLQDKCQDEGQDSLEVANVLNFIGTLLFHKKDLHNALIFFEEELRVEDKVFAGTTDMSVAVTCNNIGRICQDLGRFDDAIKFYERALQTEEITGITSTSNNQVLDQSTANLYSTVWYNIGLIHDRRSAHGQAIVAFGRSLELRKSFLCKDHPDIACLHFNIGVLQMEQDKLDEASVSLKEALKSRQCLTATNKLDDQRVIKTFEKLAMMHKNKGSIHAAIDALCQVLRVLEVTKEFDTMTRIKDMALVLRSMAELYHAAGELSTALAAAHDSVRHLDHVAQIYAKDVLIVTTDKLANIEQLVSSLLLVGSLFHELCEPIQAFDAFRRAVSTLEETIATYRHLRNLPSSLHALQEVTSILATIHCAPEA